MISIPLGEYKGLKLVFDSKFTRPTDQKTILSIFNSLNFTIDITSKTVLDLYAGSGILGLTALSLGAKSVDLVDSMATKLPEKLQKNTRIFLYSQEVSKFLTVTKSKTYGLIFIDPPYTINLKSLNYIVSLAGNLLEYKGIVVLRTANFSKDHMLFEELITTLKLRFDILNYRIFDHTIVWYLTLI